MTKITIIFILVGFLVVQSVNAERIFYKIPKQLFLEVLAKNLIAEWWFDAEKCKSTGQQEKEFHYDEDGMDRWGVEFQLPKEEGVYIDHEEASLLPLGEILFRNYLLAYGSGEEVGGAWAEIGKGQYELLSILNSVDHFNMTDNPKFLKQEYLLKGYAFNRDIFSQFIGDADIYSEENISKLNDRALACGNMLDR